MGCFVGVWFGLASVARVSAAVLYRVINVRTVNDFVSFLLDRRWPGEGPNLMSKAVSQAFDF